jgi:hypothetical protein
MELTDFPGGDLIAIGLDDLGRGHETIPLSSSPSARRACGAWAIPFLRVFAIPSSGYMPWTLPDS